jgi:hypothetical protein
VATFHQAFDLLVQRPLATATVKIVPDRDLHRPASLLNVKAAAFERSPSIAIVSSRV